MSTGAPPANDSDRASVRGVTTPRGDERKGWMLGLSEPLSAIAAGGLQMHRKGRQYPWRRRRRPARSRANKVHPKQGGPVPPCRYSRAAMAPFQVGCEAGGRAGAELAHRHNLSSLQCSPDCLKRVLEN